MPNLPSLICWVVPERCSSGHYVLYTCWEVKIGTENGLLCNLYQAMPVPVNENLVFK